jgi:hypothetical protein
MTGGDVGRGNHPATRDPELEEFGLQVAPGERIKVIRDQLDSESVPIQLLIRGEGVPAVIEVMVA